MRVRESNCRLEEVHRPRIREVIFTLDNAIVHEGSLWILGKYMSLLICYALDLNVHLLSCKKVTEYQNFFQCSN